MSPPAPPSKQVLRAEARVRLASLSPEQRLDGSLRIGRRLEASAEFNAARTLLAFHPLPTEPDFRPFMDSWVGHGRTLCLPRWHAASQEYRPACLVPDSPLATGPFGVAEPGPDCPPVPWAELDLILVPGLAFDAMGRRLGRGRGFYDRLLARAGRARPWGVAFEIQMLAAVPAEPHDVNMHVLVTPERIWAVPPSS